jgi:epsilon-lactone hydrolase
MSVKISPEAQAAIAAMRALSAARPPVRDLKTDRANWSAEEAAKPIPHGGTVETVTIAGITCEWMRTGPSKRVFVLIHGGGYVNGAPLTHRRLAAYISKAAGADVLMPDYRLAPEHPWPAGIDDCLAVWKELIATHDPAQIAMGGDSAGGGLALGLSLRLRALELTQPRALTLLSPWTDILARGASYELNRAADPGISAERLQEAGRWYTGSADPETDEISPINADLTGLPPMLIHVGGIEAMLDDSAMLAAHAMAAGVPCEFRVYPGLWHVWQHAAETVPEAADAIADIGRYIRSWT